MAGFDGKIYHMWIIKWCVYVVKFAMEQQQKKNDPTMISFTCYASIITILFRNSLRMNVYTPFGLWFLLIYIFTLRPIVYVEENIKTVITFQYRFLKSMTKLVFKLLNNRHNQYAISLVFDKEINGDCPSIANPLYLKS